MKLFREYSYMISTDEFLISLLGISSGTILSCRNVASALSFNSFSDELIHAYSVKLMIRGSSFNCTRFLKTLLFIKKLNGECHCTSQESLMASFPKDAHGKAPLKDRKSEKRNYRKFVFRRQNSTTFYCLLFVVSNHIWRKFCPPPPPPRVPQVLVRLNSICRNLCLQSLFTVCFRDMHLCVQPYVFRNFSKMN